MRRGPKPKYCYVCQKDGPCSGDDKCNRLSVEEKAKAYRIGYYAAHADRLNSESKDRYWSSTVAPEFKQKKEQREIDKAKIKQERTRIAEEARAESERKKQISQEQRAALAATLRASGRAHGKRDTSITPEQREKDKRERWKKTMRTRRAPRIGRLKSDQEAD